MMFAVSDGQRLQPTRPARELLALVIAGGGLAPRGPDLLFSERTAPTEEF